MAAKPVPAKPPVPARRPAARKQPAAAVRSAEAKKPSTLTKPPSLTPAVTKPDQDDVEPLPTLQIERVVGPPLSSSAGGPTGASGWAATLVASWRSSLGAVREARGAASAVGDDTSAASVVADEMVTAGANTEEAIADDVVLSIRGLTKRFGDVIAVDGIDIEVRAGDFYGIVGPNGAGKTTTLSMITGLLRPDSGTVVVHGTDVWGDPGEAKRHMGVLPDRLRLFDRLTGAQLLYYSGILRGLDAALVRSRSDDLARAFGLEDSMGRLVNDFSAGMTKKIALAAAMIHSPRILVLDEPFESMDPVSAATVSAILESYASAGGTVVLSSHSMDLVQRMCDHVAVVVDGQLLAQGTVEQVRAGRTLEERFIELTGGPRVAEGLQWLHNFSD